MNRNSSFIKKVPSRTPRYNQQQHGSNVQRYTPRQTHSSVHSQPGRGYGYQEGSCGYPTQNQLPSSYGYSSYYTDYPTNTTTAIAPQSEYYSTYPQQGYRTQPQEEYHHVRQVSENHHNSLDPSGATTSSNSEKVAATAVISSEDILKELSLDIDLDEMLSNAKGHQQADQETVASAGITDVLRPEDRQTDLEDDLMVATRTVGQKQESHRPRNLPTPVKRMNKISMGKRMPESIETEATGSTRSKADAVDDDNDSASNGEVSDTDAGSDKGERVESPVRGKARSGRSRSRSTSSSGSSDSNASSIAVSHAPSSASRTSANKRKESQKTKSSAKNSRDNRTEKKRSTKEAETGSGHNRERISTSHSRSRSRSRYSRSRSPESRSSKKKKHSTEVDCDSNTGERPHHPKTSRCVESNSRSSGTCKPTVENIPTNHGGSRKNSNEEMPPPPPTTVANSGAHSSRKRSVGAGSNYSAPSKRANVVQTEDVPESPALPTDTYVDSVNQVFTNVMQHKSNSPPSEQDAVSKSTSKTKQTQRVIRRPKAATPRLHTLEQLICLLIPKLQKNELAISTVKVIKECRSNVGSALEKKDRVREAIQRISFVPAPTSNVGATTPGTHDYPVIDREGYLMSVMDYNYGYDHKAIQGSKHIVPFSLLNAITVDYDKRSHSLDVVFRRALKEIVFDLNSYDEQSPMTLNNPVFISGRYLELALLKKIRTYYKRNLQEDIVHYLTSIPTPDDLTIIPLVDNSRSREYVRILLTRYKMRVENFDQVLEEPFGNTDMMRVWADRKSQTNTNIQLQNYMNSVFKEVNGVSGVDNEGWNLAAAQDFSVEYLKRLEPFMQSHDDFFSEVLKKSELMAYMCFGITTNINTGSLLTAFYYHMTRNQDFDTASSSVCWNLPLASRYRHDNSMAKEQPVFTIEDFLAQTENFVPEPPIIQERVRIRNRPANTSRNQDLTNANYGMVQHQQHIPHYNNSILPPFLNQQTTTVSNGGGARILSMPSPITSRGQDVANTNYAMVQHQQQHDNNNGVLPPFPNQQTATVSNGGGARILSIPSPVANTNYAVVQHQQQHVPQYNTDNNNGVLPPFPNQQTATVSNGSGSRFPPMPLSTESFPDAPLPCIDALNVR